METVERLRALLPDDAAAQLARRGGALCEARLRAGRPVQLIFSDGEWLSAEAMDAVALRRALSSLSDHSLYAREDELRQGFFTLSDGCRVGVCGRLSTDGDSAALTAAGSACVRIRREVRNCAEPVLRLIDRPDGVRSALVLSPPGMGKTTLLRELARRLSDGGRNVCIADERHELAACRDGVPTLDVGLRTDVMDGGPKREAILHMLRAVAPEVIVADEIGSEGDAEALAEAARCGAAVIASAHAASFEAMANRRTLRPVAESGVFSLGMLLGGRPGRIAEIRTFSAGEGWHALGAGDVRGDWVRGLRSVDGRGRAAADGDAQVAGQRP